MQTILVNSKRQDKDDDIHYTHDDSNTKKYEDDEEDEDIDEDEDFDDDEYEEDDEYDEERINKHVIIRTRTKKEINYFYLFITSIVSTMFGGFLVDHLSKRSNNNDLTQQMLMMLCNHLINNSSNNNKNDNSDSVNTNTKNIFSSMIDNNYANYGKLRRARVHENWKVKKDLDGNVIDAYKTHDYVK